MARARKTDSEKMIEVLQDLLIATLGYAGVAQLDIRKIVGVNIVRVNRILRHLKPRKG